MNTIEKLIKIFSDFPGIGPRQARRFVYYLLTRHHNALEDLAKNILELKMDIINCSQCKRFFEPKYKQKDVCNICSDENRDHSVIMLVQRDIDLESVEKNAVFRGIYFVLGGSIPILEKEPSKRIRIRELEMRINHDQNIKEIILGMNWNPEGENTANFIQKNLKSIVENKKIKISNLGKGLSMGTELEYTDPDTLKNALRNRN